MTALTIWIASSCFALLAMTAHALPLETPLPDPAQEAQAREIFHALRCVVCQGESIADSNAQVATDMRREIRTQVANGKTQEEILRYFTERYSDFVLMSPPFKPQTLLLWLAPFLALIIGGVIVRGQFQSKRPRR